MRLQSRFEHFWPLNFSVVVRIHFNPKHFGSLVYFVTSLWFYRLILFHPLYSSITSILTSLFYIRFHPTALPPYSFVISTLHSHGFYVFSELVLHLAFRLLLGLVSRLWDHSFMLLINSDISSNPFTMNTPSLCLIQLTITYPANFSRISWFINRLYLFYFVHVLRLLLFPQILYILSSLLV